MRIYYQGVADEQPEYTDSLEPGQKLDVSIYQPVVDKSRLRTALIYKKGNAVNTELLESLQNRARLGGAATDATLRGQFYGLDANEVAALQCAFEEQPVSVLPRDIDPNELRIAGQIQSGVYQYHESVIYVPEKYPVTNAHLRRLSGLKSGTVYLWYREKFILQRDDAVMRGVVDYLPFVLEEAEKERKKAHRRTKSGVPRKTYGQIALNEQLGSYQVYVSARDFTVAEKRDVRMFVAQSVEQLQEVLTPSRHGTGHLKGSTVRQQRKMVESAVEKILEFWELMAASLNGSMQGTNLVNHAFKSSVLAMEVATDLQLPKKDVLDVGMSALLEDVGLSRMERLVDKKGPLTPTELIEIRQHPIVSSQILEGSDNLPPIVSTIALQSHERLDGRTVSRRMRHLA